MMHGPINIRNCKLRTPRDEWFQAFAANYTRTALFWAITQWNNVSVPFSRVQNYWPLKKGLIDCPETSVRNYHYPLHNSPEELSSLGDEQEFNELFLHNTNHRKGGGRRRITNWIKQEKCITDEDATEIVRLWTRTDIFHWCVRLWKFICFICKTLIPLMFLRTF